MRRRCRLRSHAHKEGPHHSRLRACGSTSAADGPTRRAPSTGHPFREKGGLRHFLRRQSARQSMRSLRSNRCGLPLRQGRTVDTKAPHGRFAVSALPSAALFALVPKLLTADPTHQRLGGRSTHASGEYFTGRGLGESPECRAIHPGRRGRALTSDAGEPTHSARPPTRCQSPPRPVPRRRPKRINLPATGHATCHHHTAPSADIY